MKEVVTKKEIARKFRVTERTVTNWMKGNRISFLKIGRLVRFDGPTVEEELKNLGLVPAVKN